MTEILTESFCERCGTRYTFESAAPRRSRIGRVRTISKGLRNFVLSDETTFSEAMADARSEEEIAATATQLDAFHKTFNFCMTCRQYTCGSCWNQAEGRCLTCAPHLGHEIMPAPLGGAVPMHPAQAAAGNGHDGAAGEADPADLAPGPGPDTWPEADLDPDRLARAMGLSATLPDATAPVAWPEAEPLGDELDLVATAPEVAVPDVDVAEAPELPELAAASEPDPAVAAMEPAPEAAEATPVVAPEIIGLAAGQSLDDAIAAYEATLAAEEATATAAAPAPAADASVAGEVPAAGEAPATEPRVEPVIAAVEEAAPPAPSPGPDAEPVAAPMAEPAVAAPLDAEPPLPAAPAVSGRDVIAQPAWPVPPPTPVAPITGEPAAPTPAAPTPITPASPWLTVAPDTDAVDAPAAEAPPPQWPATPQWPAPQAWAPSPSRRPEPPRTLAGRPLLSADAAALWAASDREVRAQAPAAAPSAQPCISCGLSLSANARFCRRCGSPQG